MNLKCKLKQIAVIFLIMATVVTYMPGMNMIAYASENVEEINTEQELSSFAERVNSGDATSSDAVLTRDITVSSGWVPVGNDNHPYAGTFDGGKHRIIFEGTSYGLMGNLTGTVKNVITAGTISGEENIGAVAGISSGTVENCLNEATVTGNGDYIGGIAGNMKAGTIRTCGNQGNVTNNSTTRGRYTAGIAGNASGVIENCFNWGNVETKRTRAGVNCGGIAGNANNLTMSNCYNTGLVIATSDSATNYGAVGGLFSGSTAINCYYLSGSCANGINGGNASAEPKDEEYMKTADFVTDLGGEAFIGKSGSYPVLSWQTPTASVSFVISPEDAVLTVCKNEEEVYTSNRGGERHLTLESGEYNYTVTKDGYRMQSGNINISEDDALNGIHLTPISVSLEKDETLWGLLKFTVEGADEYTITLKDGESVVDEEAEGQYRVLLNHDYSYCVMAEGCEDVVGTVNLTDNEKTENVTLPVVDSVKIKKSPDKTEYYTGDKLDTTGLELEIKYTDNTTRTASEGFSVSGFDSSVPAESQPVNVSYKGKTTVFHVTIKEKPFPSTVFNGLAGKAKVEYIHNDKWNGEAGTEFIDDETEEALKSNSAGQSSSTVTAKITIEESVKPSILSFNYKVSSEGGTYSVYDGLQINGGNKIGGNIGWTAYRQKVSGGDVIELTYSKDPSSDSGSDCAWLKDFQLKQLRTATFNVPKNAEIRLVKSGDNKTVTPDSHTDGTTVYSLESGEYEYTVSKFGYKTVTDTLNIGDDDITCNINLEALPNQKVKFVVTLPAGIDGNTAIEVKSGSKVISAEEDGSYRLPEGEYTYKVTNPNCYEQNGSFSVGSSEQEIPVTMERKLVFSDFFDGVSGYLNAVNGTNFGFSPVLLEGENVLASTNQNKGNSSAFITLTATKAGKLSFKYKIGSEPKYDWLDITVNGQSKTDKTNFSNQIDWTEFVQNVAAGDVIKIAYTKDSSGDKNGDTVWLKDFSASSVTAVTFDGIPNGGIIDLKRGTQNISAQNGTYYLEPGEYTYSVKAFGYETLKEQKLTIGEETEKTVAVTMRKVDSVKIVFNISPTSENDSLQVFNAYGDNVESFKQADGIYNLPKGEFFTYSVVAEGYIPVKGSFTTNNERTYTVTLENAGEAWDGKTKTEPNVKDGVYQIGTATELAWFADKVNTGETGVNGKVIANINLADKTWNSIGNSDNQYAGTFDGGNKTISGLKGANGLFDYIATDGTVKNTAVIGNIKGTYNIGGIAGTNNGKIIDCKFSGRIENTSSSIQSAGGIAGRCPSGSANASIEGCVNYAEIVNSATFYSETGSVNIGGIVGYAYREIRNCYNAGAVKANSTNGKDIGGIAGKIGADASLENCYNIGAVSGGSNRGAVIGTSEGTITNTYYLKGTATQAFGNATSTSSGVPEEKNAEEMKTDNFTAVLNGECDYFNMDSEEVNEGFPVLKWQGGTPANVSDNEADVQSAKTALELKDGSGELLVADSQGHYQIKNNSGLMLTETGENNTKIVWNSSNSDIISETGKVTLPQDGKETVTLTATISKNTALTEKKFTIVVWSESAQNQEYLNEIAKKFNERNVIIEPLQCYDLDATGFMRQKLEREGVDVDWDALWDNEGVKVEFISPGEKVYGEKDVTYIDEQGNITYYSNANPGTSMGMNYAMHRNVQFRLSLGEQSVVVSCQFKIGWDEFSAMDLMDSAIEKLTWDDIRGDNPAGSVVEKSNWWQTETVDRPIVYELKLPTKLADAGFATIKWSSSNELLGIYATGQSDENGYEIYKAYLNRPPYGEPDGTVVLTAEMRFNLTSEYLEGEYKNGVSSQKNFVITVKANDTDTTAEINEKLEKYPELIRDFVNKDTEIDPDKVTADLQMPIPSTLETEGIFTDRYNQKVTILSDNTDVLDFYGYHGYVYRPLPGEEPVNVNYTVIISDRRNGADLARKTFTMTVLPLTQQEIDDAVAWMKEITTEDVYWNGIKGENNARDNVTENMRSFVEILKGENGEPEYVYSMMDKTFGGIETSDLPGYDPMMNDTWRAFRTSRPTVVAYESLRITPPEYDTKVTVDSVFSYSEYAKYWEKFGNTDSRYALFEQFYKQPVSTTVTVKGTTGEVNPNPDKDTITATVSIMGKGKFRSLTKPVTNLSAYTGTAWNAVTNFLNDNGYTFISTGDYISSITDSNGVTLSDKDTENSGWLYKVNGKLADTYMGGYYLKDGDVIELYYTSDYKEDPDAGGFFPEEKPEVSLDVPTADIDNEATAKIDKSDIDKLIDSALKDKASAIKLNVKGAEKADKITVELPKQSVADISSKTDTSLNVDAPLGTATFDRRAMTETVKQAEGDTIKLVFEKLSDTVTKVSLISGDKEITDLGTAKVKINLPVSDSQKDKTLAVAYKGKDGKLVKLTGKAVTIGGKKFYQIETSLLGEFTLDEEAKIDELIKAQGGETDEEKTERIKAGVEKTTIKLKSTAGKGYIKLNWQKSKGYKVDYFEVYKSTKRFKGFGKTAYFKTKTGTAKTYKNTKELKKGIRYYYKVRGVRVIDGKKVYTEYSNKAWRVAK